MDIELKLGQEFFVDDFKLMVVEGKNCKGCFFHNGKSCQSEDSFMCCKEFRHDKKNVLFVESNLPAPPETPQQTDTRSYNVGTSDYSKHRIQPWDIWIEYGLNPFDADIVKRVLRRKAGEDRVTDYKKIMHICQERIRQLQAGDDPFGKDDK